MRRPRAALKARAPFRLGRALGIGVAAVALVIGTMLTVDYWAFATQHYWYEFSLANLRTLTLLGRAELWLLPCALAIGVFSVMAHRAASRMAAGAFAVMAVRASFVFAAIAVPDSSAHC